jgi:hypothetical protein
MFDLLMYKLTPRSIRAKTLPIEFGAPFGLILTGQCLFEPEVIFPMGKGTLNYLKTLQVRERDSGDS